MKNSSIILINVLISFYKLNTIRKYEDFRLFPVNWKSLSGMIIQQTVQNHSLKIFAKKLKPDIGSSLSEMTKIVKNQKAAV